MTTAFGKDKDDEAEGVADQIESVELVEVDGFDDDDDDEGDDEELLMVETVLDEEIDADYFGETDFEQKVDFVDYQNYEEGSNNY